MKSVNHGKSAQSMEPAKTFSEPSNMTRPTVNAVDVSDADLAPPYSEDHNTAIAISEPVNLQTTLGSNPTPTDADDKMEDLPDRLEAFYGWSADPTDEEVDELIQARERFSQDLSCDLSEDDDF